MSELEECLPGKFMSLTWILVSPLMHPLVYTFLSCAEAHKMPQPASTVISAQWERSAKQEVVEITRIGDYLEIWKGQGSA